MTGTPDPTDRWLTDQHANTRDGLNRFLDLDTGLREATLPGEHTNLQGSLSSRLDIEAGLEAALSRSPAPEPLSPAPQTGSRQPDVVAAIKAIDPAVRMALRRDPIILAVILSDFLVRALDLAIEVIRYRDPYNGVLGIRAITRARDLASNLDFDIARARDLTRPLDRVRSRALDPDRGLTRDRSPDRARDLALYLHPNIAHALAHDLAGDLTHALALNVALGLATDLDYARSLRDRALDITHDLDLSHAFTHERVCRHLAPARDLAQRVAVAAGRALGIQQVDGLAAALLDGVLDDFTDADLTHADLTDADLTGVRWSVSGTRWPPGTDIEALRAQSREVVPGADVYVIMAPGDGKETRHDVHV